MNVTTPRHALGWLEQQPEFVALSQRADRLLQLQTDLRACARGLELTALGLDGEDLLVGVPSAPVAAKLRQLAPSIARELQDRGWQVKRIRFRPQPAAQGSASAPFRAKAPIPGPAVDGLQALAEKATSPALKEALAHLVRSQRRQQRGR